MIDIDLLGDDDLQDAVNPFISSLLPHDNFDPDYFTGNLSIIFGYIELQEFKMEYRMLLSALHNLNRLKLSMQDFRPELTRETFIHLLSVSVGDVVNDVSVGVVDQLQFNGQDSDLRNEKVREEAQQLLCTRSLELYDICFRLQQDSAGVLNLEPALRDAFMQHVSIRSINVQHKIIRQGLRVGRRMMSGCGDWLSYTSSVVSDLKRRLDSRSDDTVFSVDSMEGSLNLLKNLKVLFVPIAYWGIPPLDNYTPMLEHRLVVVVGTENIGKTKFAVDKAVNVLLAGRKVEFMCGESHKAKVYADIIINYIWKKYSLIVRPIHVAAPEECPDDIRKVICMTIDEIVTSQALILRDAFDYSTCYDEMAADYEQYHFDLCVIDHSCALTGFVGDGSVKVCIDKLAADCRLFRKNYPVCILVTSHPSQLAKDDLARERPITNSPTKGSQNLSTDADELFVMRDNETLRKQNLLTLENYKRRDAAIAENMILQKKFEVSALIYDPAKQAANVQMSAQKEDALRQYSRSFNEMEEDDDDYID